MTQAWILPILGQFFEKKKNVCVEDLQESHRCGCKAVGRSENPGGRSNNLEEIIYPMVEIGLSDLPKWGGGGLAPLAPLLQQHSGCKIRVRSGNEKCIAQKIF
jgi:hypothetical protein